MRVQGGYNDAHNPERVLRDVAWRLLIRRGRREHLQTRADGAGARVEQLNNSARHAVPQRTPIDRAQVRKEAVLHDQNEPAHNVRHPFWTRNPRLHTETIFEEWFCRIKVALLIEVYSYGNFCELMQDNRIKGKEWYHNHLYFSWMNLFSEITCKLKWRHCAAHEHLSEKRTSDYI